MAYAPQINQTARRGLRSESNKRKRQRRFEQLQEKKRAADPLAAQRTEEALGFARAPPRRSAHDVVDAPPALTVRPKVRKPRDPAPSPARQRILGAERERVVQQYRALKKARAAGSD